MLRIRKTSAPKNLEFAALKVVILSCTISLVANALSKRKRTRQGTADTYMTKIVAIDLADARNGFDIFEITLSQDPGIDEISKKTPARFADPDTIGSKNENSRNKNNSRGKNKSSFNSFVPWNVCIRI